MTFVTWDKLHRKDVGIASVRIGDLPTPPPHFHRSGGFSRTKHKKRFWACVFITFAAWTRETGAQHSEAVEKQEPSITRGARVPAVEDNLHPG